MTISPRIHKIYGYLTGAAAIVAGICLMISCIGIWGAGDAPFTPASVKAAFTPISVPVTLCLILVLGGLLLDSVSSHEAEPLRAHKHAATLLQQQKQKVDPGLCGPVLSKDIRKLEQLLQRCSFMGILIPCLLASAFLGYTLNPGHFAKEDPTGSVVKAMCVLLPCLAAALVSGIVLHQLHVKTTNRLIKLLKQAPARKDCSLSPAPPQRNGAKAVQALLIVAAIAMIAYGVLSGGTKDVLIKAVNICTECVGLG